MSISDQLLRLACPIQRMDFGSKGNESLAYQLFKSGGHDKFFGNKDDGHFTPFAELWMGSGHSKGESVVLSCDPPKQLSQVVLGSARENYLGTKLLRRFPTITGDTHGGIPFIFKVLSAGKPLPLQVHPNLQEGKRFLMSEGTTEEADIAMFDSMHKPEIALALTDFEAFIGFAPKKVIANRLSALPELCEMLKNDQDRDVWRRLLLTQSDCSESDWSKDMSYISKCILSSSPQMNMHTINKIIAQKRRHDVSSDVAEVIRLIHLCNKAHPGGDSGVLYAPLFLNYARLQPGDCIYAPSDTVHAWVEGSIIECMASSSNVINTGFGPKPSTKAVDIFTEMLSYKARPLKDFLVEPQPYFHSKGGGDGLIYSVPEEEFSVLAVTLKSGQSIELDPIEGPSVILGFEGHAKIEARSTKNIQALDMSPGTVILIASEATVGISTGDEFSPTGFKAYLTYCNLS